MAWRSRNDRNDSRVASPHDFYSSVCACGKTLEGERTNSSQKVTCPGCGEAHYILPRDVYPRPKILAPPPVPEVPEVDFDLLEGTDLEPARATVEAPEPPPVKPREKTAPPPRVWVDAGRGPFVRRKIVVLSSLACVILGFTIWWRLRIKWQGEAEITFREQLHLASEAVAEGQWDEARDSAQQASAAVDYLGLDHAAARWVGQLHRSLFATGNLAVDSPVEIVLKKIESRMSDEEWGTHFRVHYANQWIVFSGEVIRETTRVDEQDVTRLRLDDPLQFGDEEVHIGWKGEPEWSRLLSYDQNRAPLCVAARLEGIEFVRTDAVSRWKIVLGDDAFLWTETALARHVGLTPDDPEAESRFLSLLSGHRDKLGIPEERP